MTDLEGLCVQVARRFASQGLTLATAESLTGGMIASALAGVSGVSRVLKGGVVSYAPEVKRDVLGVAQQVIDTVGVVSAPCARQMALGARKALGADVAVSATGIAGPDGGTAQTPVGAVFIGACGPGGERVEECHFSGDRLSIRRQSACRALEMALEVAQA